jgi:hypothetical protein
MQLVLRSIIGLNLALTVLAMNLMAAPQAMGDGGGKFIFCSGAEVPLEVPLTGLPVSFKGNKVTSFQDTYGVLTITSTASKSIEEFDLQVEYREHNQGVIGPLWYGATTGQAPHAYYDKLQNPLAPQASITLHATSLRVFTACPTSGRVTAIHVHFSDGSEFNQKVSRWAFEPSPRKLPSPRFPVGSLPAHDCAYLFELTISATGDVKNIRHVKSTTNLSSLPLENEIHGWHFRPETRDGIPVESSVLVVLRILRSGHDISKGEVPFAIEDLSPTFLLISLPPRTGVERSIPEFEDFEVFFGTVQFSGSSEIIW